VTSQRKRKTAGRRKISSLSTAARYLYSAGGGDVDLVRPRRVIDPVAMARPPSYFQARGGWRWCEPVSARWVGPVGGLRLGCCWSGKFSSFFICFSFYFLPILLFSISNLYLLNCFAGFKLIISYKIDLGYSLTQHFVSGYNYVY
jgi:hypothetical protein